MGRRRRRRKQRSIPSPFLPPEVSSHKSALRKWLDEGISAKMIGPVLLVVLSVTATYIVGAAQGGREDEGAERSKDERLAAQPALKVKVRQIGDDGTSFIWLFKYPILEVQVKLLNNELKNGASANSKKIDSLMTSFGGKRTYDLQSPGWGNVHKVTLIGNRRLPLEITEIELRVKDRSPAPTGTLLYGHPQGGGESKDVFLTYDLSGGDVVEAYSSKNDRPIKYFDNFSYSLAEGESGAFRVTTHGNCYCKWELLVRSRSGGKDQAPVTIRADGTSSGPLFETIGVQDANVFSSYFAYSTEHKRMLKWSKLFDGDRYIGP